MFSVKKTASTLLLIFSSLWLTACGLPPGPNTAPNFASNSSPTLFLSSSGDSKNPQIAVDGSKNIFVVWQAGGNINFVSSNNGGASFSTPINVPGSGGGTFPRITTDGAGNAYVIWYYNFQILLNYATSSGFQTTLPISTTTVQASLSGIAPPSDISYNAVSKSLYVSWTQCSTCSPTNTIINDIFYTTIPVANPLTVATPTNVTNNNSSFVFLGYPKITLFGGVPYVVYQTTTPTSGLYLSKMTTAINVAGSQPTASSASLGVDSSGNSFVAWNPANPNGNDVYFNLLKTGTSQFNSIPLNLSNNGVSYGPAIGIDSSQYVYVAFFSRSSIAPNLYDVFLERSADGGKSFTGAMNISNTPGDSASYAPGMAILGKTAYVVWDDNSATGGNHQIYFQKITLN